LCVGLQYLLQVNSSTNHTFIFFADCYSLFVKENIFATPIKFSSYS
jgi:hypothetical protein